LKGVAFAAIDMIKVVEETLSNKRLDRSVEPLPLALLNNRIDFSAKLLHILANEFPSHSFSNNE